MCVLTVNKKRSHEFEIDKGGVYRKVWREEMRSRNIIIIQSQKYFLKFNKMIVWEGQTKIPLSLTSSSWGRKVKEPHSASSRPTHHGSILYRPPWGQLENSKALPALSLLSKAHMKPPWLSAKQHELNSALGSLMTSPSIHPKGREGQANWFHTVSLKTTSEWTLQEVPMNEWMNEWQRGRRYKAARQHCEPSKKAYH